MLQISHTEKPICSATIDQIRLRRATILPVVFQNVSSSGLQSESQVEFGAEFCSLIERLPFSRHDSAPWGGPSAAWSANFMDDVEDGFDGVSQGRHSSFVPAQGRPISSAITVSC